MAKPTTRVYLVAEKREDSEANPVRRRLVRASHQANALRHVAEDVFSVSLATQEDLIALVSDGVQVERIGPEQQQLPTT